jgi:hypothetical protein
MLISQALPVAAQSSPPTETPWNKVAETASVTLYTDPESIEREGMIRRVTEFQDLKQPDPDGVLSRRYKNEYDCQNRMHRIGKVSSFSENRLSGTRRFQVDDWGYWRTVQPNTPFALMYLSLCSDRRR